jgi:hypothetical protein
MNRKAVLLSEFMPHEQDGTLSQRHDRDGVSEDDCPALD